MGDGCGFLVGRKSLVFLLPSFPVFDKVNRARLGKDASGTELKAQELGRIRASRGGGWWGSVIELGRLVA